MLTPPQDTAYLYWMFTDFDMHRIEELEKLLPAFAYLVYQLEKCPDTGKYHYQGYVAFLKRQRMSTLIRLIPGIHLEKRKGTHSQAKKYCMKEDTRVEGPFEFGDDSEISEGQGQRSDLGQIKESLDNGAGLLDIAETHFGDFVRYHKSFKLYKELTGERLTMNELAIEYSAAILRPWQRRAFERLSSQTDREFHWYWDESGNKGKSYFARYLEARYNAYLITNGKHADIYYAYEMQTIIAFDLSRSHSMDNSIYEMIECFKNGRIFSSKYESKAKKIPSCKVIVFANFAPNSDYFSKDRAKIFEIQDIMDQIPNRRLPEPYIGQ